MTLHQVGSEGRRPDLTLLIEVSAEQVADRLDKRDSGVSDAIGGREAAYHASVASAFAAFAEAEPKSFAQIDGDGTPEAVHQRILAAILPLLSGDT